MILRMIQLEGYHQWSYLNIWCWLSFSCTILTVSQTQNLFLTQGFFKKNKFIYLFIFGCIGFSLLRADFSVVVASGGYSSLWCTGFSLQWLLIAEHGLYVHRLQQLWHVGSVVVARGLSSCGSRAQQLWHTGFVAPRHVGSSRTRARTCVPCIGRRILNHCTTREVPHLGLLYLVFSLPGNSSSPHLLPLVRFMANYFTSFRSQLTCHFLRQRLSLLILYEVASSFLSLLLLLYYITIYFLYGT